MEKKLLVCDLDNTLYDWVSYFVHAFYAMVDAAVPLLDCDREVLLDDFRSVHQRYHDSEHPFALLETNTVRERFAGLTREEIAKRLDPAFLAFNSARRKYLKLHTNVQSTLEALTTSGIKIIAHTESNLFAAIDRIVRLKIEQFFAKVYCRERAETKHPSLKAAQHWLQRNPLHRVVELSRHQAKPNPNLLLEICAKERIEPQAAAYIGDSVARDVLMAKRAGVYAIWAGYGAKHDPAMYEKLVRITHWTSEDVEREKRLWIEAKSIRPDFIAEHSFSEVITALNSESRDLQVAHR